MPNINGRQIVDAAFSTTKAMPAAGASASTTAFNLGAPGYSQPERVEYSIAWPAMTALADTKTLTIVVEDSADNSTFASIGVSKVLTGAGGVGVAAGEFLFRVASTCRSYLRVTTTAVASSGDVTASSLTFKALF